MKKLICLMIGFVLAAGAANGQYYRVSGSIYTVSDTLTGQSDNYYYNPQDELCPWFLQNSPATYRVSGYEGQKFIKLARIEHTDRRMAVRGIAAMVMRDDDYLRDNNDWIYFTSPTPGKKAEYLYLCTGDTTRYLDVRDSVRWDTLTPRLWKFPKTPDALTSSDPDSFLYCHLFEAMFDEPLLVDSTFILAGSFYSNSDANPKTYIPTSYYAVTEDYDVCNTGCHEDTAGYLYSYLDSTYLQELVNEAYAYYDSLGQLDQFKDSIDYAISLIRRFRLDRWRLGHLGPFLAIVDFYQLEVAVNDNQKGWAWGGGRFPDRSLDTITARAKPGFCFVQWSDGNTDNPRVIDLTQDTLFTAVFDTCTSQEIVPPDKAQLAFTAMPNPATNTVTVSTATGDNYQLVLYDMAGRCLAQTAFNGTSATLDISPLAAGSYQLSLRSASASGIKIIIKQ